MLEGPRAAHEKELQAAITLSNRVFYPDGSLDMGSAFPTLFSVENLENLRVFSEKGTPVSMVGFTLREISILGSTVRLACIGSVCTDDSHRGQGLASRLMEDAVAHALTQEASLILVSGKRELYRRMGCVDAGLYATTRVAKGSALPELTCDVREWSETDLPRMIAARQAEPVRFLRGLDEMRVLLESRMLLCKPSRTWTVNVGGEMIAYLCAQDPVEEEGRKILKVREIAGSRFAILASLRSLFDTYAVDRIDVDILALDDEMWGQGLALGLPVMPHGFQGTVKVIDPRGFFRSMGGYIEERLTERESEELTITVDSVVAFRLQEESFALAAGDVAPFVFGTAGTPVPGPQTPALRALCEKLFPMPLADYGLNFI